MSDLFLQIQRKDGSKRFLNFTKDQMILGRAESCDITIDDQEIDAVQAVMELDRSALKVFVYDLSMNARIRFQGKVESSLTIGVGEAFSVGSTEMVFIEKKNQRETPDDAKAHQEMEPVQKPVPRVESMASPAAERSLDDTSTWLRRAPELREFLIEREDQVRPIFEERPPSREHERGFLQVVLFFGNSILDVKHIPESEDITVGPVKGSSFAWPEQFVLVRGQGQRREVCFPEGATGVVCRAGKVSKVESGASSRSEEIGKGDFARVNLGAASFFISESPSPPKLKMLTGLRTDPLFLRVWLTSLLLTLGFVIGVSQIRIDRDEEIEQLPERVATLIYRPETFQHVENPPSVNGASSGGQYGNSPSRVEGAYKKSAPSAQDSSGTEGAGPRAEGPRGERGRSQAKLERGVHKGQRSSGAMRTAGVSGDSRVQGLGIIDVLKENSGALSKVLAGAKGSAAGRELKLEGYAGFSGRGSGGAAQDGFAAGGGGRSKGIGGLASAGSGAGATGSGLGSLGNSGDIIGGKGVMVVGGGGGTGGGVVYGTIDTDAIAREIAKHRDEIKYCYEKEINADRPDLSGRISVKWLIGPSGAVQKVAIASSTMGSPSVEQCVSAVISKIVFPPVQGGGVAEVTYPFVFKPSGK